MLTYAAKWLQEEANQNRLLIGVLLVLAVSSVALGVAGLIRAALPAGYLWIMAMAALSLGSWLAGRIQKTWIGWLVMASLGGSIALFWVGQFWNPLMAWLGTLPGLFWQALQGVADWSEFEAARAGFGLRWIAFWAEIWAWLRALFVGSPVFNYTVAALGWGLALWLAAGWAGWCQRRHQNPLLAIFPGGVLLLGVMGYTYGSSQALLILLFATLMAMAVSHYARLERDWQARNMDFPEAQRGEILSRFFWLVLAFVLAAALLPRISLPALIAKVEAWASPQRAQIDPLLESFGLEAGTEPPGVLAEAIWGGLPRQHLIDASPELTRQVVMTVQLTGLTTADPSSLPGPLYWRARTYDQYTGRGWQTSQVEMQAYAAGEAAQETSTHHVRLYQTVKMQVEDQFIYAAGAILSLDQDYQLAWRTAPEAANDLFAGTVQQRVYQVTSQIPQASEAELRAAPALYPAWLTARYLALPADLPPRVAELARARTRDAATPFDKAQALESYLRTYKYQLDLPDPPRNRDVVDTFLFELQKGYCDYYASAMVVMARSVGLPARLAVGYTRGTYDPSQGLFVVTGENAHSWAEIYFDGIGWVIFEPTAAQAEIDRAALGWDQPDEIIPATQGESQDSSQRWEAIPVLRWLATIPLGLGLLWGFWILLETMYRRVLPAPRLAIHLFRRLYRFGPRLGTPPLRGQTPLEFVRALKQQVLFFGKESHQEPAFGNLCARLDCLVQLYLRAVFGAQPLDRADKLALLRLWPGLQHQLWLASWLYFWHLIRKKGSSALEPSREP